MFEIKNLENNLFRSIDENLGGLLKSAGIDISFEVAQSITTLLRQLFAADSQGIDAGTFKKPPKDLGDDDNDRGIINVMPATNMTNNITDTLVVYCMGNDNLLNRLNDALIAVGKYDFKNVIFVTTKWDNSVVTGSNAQRLRDLMEFKRKKTKFCFIFVTTSGITAIPVI